MNASWELSLDLTTLYENKTTGKSWEEHTVLVRWPSILKVVAIMYDNCNTGLATAVAMAVATCSYSLLFEDA